MAQIVTIDDKLKECGAILYDLEIIAAVPQQGELRDDSLFYCGGWEDYEGMGISVVTAYDFVESAYRIYLQDNLNELRTTINSRGIVIGYNNRRFDDNVLRANGIDVPESKSYDLWKAITSTQPDGHRKGFNLDAMLTANNLRGKTGLGSDAPMLAQTGQWGKLVNYCLDDTRKTLYILRLACNGTLKNPKNGEYMKVKLPWEEVKVDIGGLF